MRAPRPRRALLGAVAAAALVTGAAVAVPLLDSDEVFAAGRAFQEPVPSDPRLDPASDEIAALLGQEGLSATLNTGLYGQPVYEADADTPRVQVRITRAGTGEGQWGGNVLTGVEVPVPDDAVPSPGDDGKLLVIDRERGQVVDLWRAERTADGGWQAEWGGLYPLDGTGSSTSAAYGEGRFLERWPDPLSRGTGSGISSLAGIVRPQELAEGRIEHPLVFSTDRACGPAQTGEYRWPATTTDGWYVDGPCIPQGARVQLDPALDLAAIEGITPVELTIGRALQEYGAYAVDIGGARMALIAQVARTPADRRAYAEAFAPLGPPDPDYQVLERLPLERSRVLARWDGR